VIAIASSLVSGPAAWAESDQQALFATPIPEVSALVCLERSSYEFDCYIGSSDSWPEAQEGELWADYLVRSNETLGLPSGTLIWYRRSYDIEGTHFTREAWSSEEVFVYNYVGWGYFDDGEKVTLAVFITTEVRSSAEAAGDAPPVDDTIRLVKAVAFPDSEQEADDIATSWMTPAVPDDTPGGNTQQCLYGKETTGYAPYIGPCPPVPGSYAQSVAVDAKKPLKQLGPIAETQRFGVLGTATNAAGIVCLAADNACTTACDTTYANAMMSCESVHFGGQTTGAIGCAGLLLTPAGPAGALACGGASMIIQAVICWNCRVTAFNTHLACRTTCGMLLAACCNMPGTECGLQK